LCAHGGQ
jgi:hypothetical protein